VHIDKTVRAAPSRHKTTTAQRPAGRDLSGETEFTGVSKQIANREAATEVNPCSPQAVRIVDVWRLHLSFGGAASYGLCYFGGSPKFLLSGVGQRLEPQRLRHRCRSKRHSVGNGSAAGGANSVATGILSRANGANTTTIGNLSSASGDNSVAVGVVATASGPNTTAFGNLSTASGANGTAIGISHSGGRPERRRRNEQHGAWHPEPCE
jgi:YadA head domain repeat (2 copies)